MAVPTIEKPKSPNERGAEFNASARCGTHVMHISAGQLKANNENARYAKGVEDIGGGWNHPCTMLGMNHIAAVKADAAPTNAHERIMLRQLFAAFVMSNDTRLVNRPMEL